MFFGAACHAKDISFRADYWYPYNGEPTSIKPGYLIEIAQLALQEKGLTVDYQLMPWANAIKAANQGVIDCIVGPTKQEAPQLLFNQSSLGLAYPGFYARFAELDHWRYSGVESLKEHRVGVTEAVIYIDDYEVIRYLGDTKNEKVYIAKGDQPLLELMGALAKGDIDLILETSSVFKAVSKAQGVSLLFTEVDRLKAEEASVYIACSKQNPKSQQYLDLIDEKVRQLRQNGELKRLLKKYGLKDWQ